MFEEGEIVLLDGGFGTTLEDVFGKNISTPLWSAALTEKEPETVIAAHLQFLEAGSRVILTSTYQCSFETFDRAGYTHSEAIALMHKVVQLAAEAKTRFLHLHHDIKPSDVKVALALGPFGATLPPPAQEFDGFYPPPYGPMGYTSDRVNTNAFSKDRSEDEDTAIVALTQFHLERLRVFESDPKIWNLVDCIAFETVPLAREVKAIRKAIGALSSSVDSTHSPGTVSAVTGLKSWWISTVWPDARHPQESEPGSDRLSVPDVINALVGNHSPTNPLPFGIGVNCTQLEYVPRIVREFRIALSASLPTFAPSARSSHSDEHGDSKKLSLILYPNGGAKYDPISQSWLQPSTSPNSSHSSNGASNWANALVDIARTELESKAWKCVIIGGCCKTGPSDIRMLAECCGVIRGE
ncbi:Homocysteine S-methyltransferase [Rickenella mellea]|uniref:Homocysteine S-methyltransferase n=1 Tax=Rickenella mellea TaxID=50990 RepID=A0A4Y7Q3L1_9AGAM|nr:Homocysteine S-methyltransferase [Rickenella mellea]